MRKPKSYKRTLLITENDAQKKNHTHTHTHSLSLSLSLSHTRRRANKSRMNELQGVAEFDEKEQFEKRKKLTDSKRYTPNVCMYVCTKHTDRHSVQWLGWLN
jgi:hypothetical protein